MSKKPIKWTKEKIKYFIELNSEYTLIECNEDGVHANIVIMCPEKHITNTKFEYLEQNIKRGRTSCKECGNAKIGDKLRYSYEYVKEFIESFGFILVSDKYKRKDIKLDLICPFNHSFPMTFDDFKNGGHRCPICSHEIRNGSNKLSFDEVKDTVFKLGFTLISTEYLGCEIPLDLKCKYGHEFSMHIGNLRNGKGCKTCFRLSVTGEGSHLWKGGVTPENKKIRNSIEYKEWRDQVFEKDDYICQCCGKRGGKLNAHHIESFSSNEELRLDIDNGITLCKECHSPNIKGSFHNIYTQFNNTREQLEEYIQRYKSGEFDSLRFKNIG